MAGVRRGDRAPGFRLEGTDGTAEGRRVYDLAETAGRPVVLAFYPADDSPVCTRQLNAYTAGIDRFAELEAVVWAISPQSVERHESFAEANGGFGFPLLADTDKAVGESYGILGPLGFYRRSVFVVAPDGVVAYAHRAIAGATYRGTDELVEVLRGVA